ncbi:hypothetical protein [Labilibaculum manganireducens]|uniref:hypothetical protein n=1 Tax=Labilibaculum manganireducens TaxID=1940525 RepID=UPI0029F58EC7|nr:hypothetical protein [Labilibaculum manganireducens]
MKHFLPLIAILGLTLACAPPNKISQAEKTSGSNQKEKPIHLEKQIAPGTCSLIISDFKFLSENNKFLLNGKVISIKAYGAGFTSTFEREQSIQIKITEQQFMNLKSAKSISCLISCIEGVHNTPLYKLVDYQSEIKQ